MNAPEAPIHRFKGAFGIFEILKYPNLCVEVKKLDRGNRVIYASVLGLGLGYSDAPTCSCCDCKSQKLRLVQEVLQEKQKIQQRWSELRQLGTGLAPERAAAPHTKSRGASGSAAPSMQNPF